LIEKLSSRFWPGSCALHEAEPARGSPEGCDAFNHLLAGVAALVRGDAIKPSHFEGIDVGCDLKGYAATEGMDAKGIEFIGRESRTRKSKLSIEPLMEANFAAPGRVPNTAKVSGPLGADADLIVERKRLARFKRGEFSQSF
jgi:hypothetical protein